MLELGDRAGSNSKPAVDGDKGMCMGSQCCCLLTCGEGM